MATLPVGVGIQGSSIAANVITLSRGIGGDGVTDFSAGFIQNVTQTITKAIVSVTRDTADRNKITAVEVADSTGWLATDFFILRADNSTTTFATVVAAAASAGAGDVITISPFNANGDRSEFSSSPLTISNTFTVESHTIGAKTFLYVKSGICVDITAAATFRDFIVFNVGAQISNSIRTNHSSGTAIVERCVAYGSPNTGFVQEQNASTAIFNNCIAVGADQGYIANGTGTATFNYCAAVYCASFGFRRNVGTAMNNNNCVAFDCGTDFINNTGGSNNASSDATAPGANSITNLTIDQAKFVHDFSATTSSEFPIDWRPMDISGSSLAGAGIAVGGVTLDYDGNTRSGTTPDIGPSEDFTGFGVAPAAPAPAAPVLTLVSVASGQVTLNVTGDVGVTNQLLFRTSGAFQTGVTRSGNGNLVQTGLTNGVAHEFVCVAQN